MQKYISTLTHRYLRIPYTLHTFEFRSPKNPRATYVFIHGIGNTLHSWDDVVAKMPRDVRLIGIDLLGFGKSPKPNWAVYDAKTQAQSVAATLIKLRLMQRPIIVGHSLGALVAVEIAKRYPFVPSRLVLCGPPFYKPKEGKMSFSTETVLRSIYETATKHPEQLVHLSPLFVKVGIANKSLNISDANIESYVGALEASIINQTSLQDVANLKLPITIFYGLFDPVVIGKHIVRLGKECDNITVNRVPYTHEIIGGYVDELAKYLARLPEEL